MPANPLAQQYLNTFEAGREFPGGLAFRTALGQVKLDYTPDSLARIDALLRQMRDRLKPEFSGFVAKHENQNFLYLLCFYIGTVVIRYTGQDFAWYSYQELQEVAPPEFLEEYPESFGSSMICMLKDGSVYLPLSAVLDILFDPDLPADRGVLAAAERYMGRRSDARIVSRPDMPVDANASGDRALRSLAALCGWAAAYAVGQTHDGRPLPPTLQHEFDSGKRLGIAIADGSLDEAMQRLDRNEENAPRSLLLYEGRASFPAFRSDALVVEARLFGPVPMEFTLALPYRAPAAGAPFAVHAPYLIRPVDLGLAQQQVFDDGFYRGVDSFQPTGLFARALAAWSRP